MSDPFMPITKNAERNNDKLFPVFQKNLSSNSSTEFGTAAEKLSGWLSRDKAYYTKARPMIVAMLETAQETVRRHSGSSSPFHISQNTDNIKPWGDPYIKLLRTVIPFFLLFPERPLQLRLRALIQAVCDNVDVFLSQQSLLSPSLAISAVQLASSQPSRPSSGAFLPDPATPLPSVPPTMNPEQPRPKAKKRKTWVDTDFIEADLNWFRDKHSTDTPTTPSIGSDAPNNAQPVEESASQSAADSALTASAQDNVPSEQPTLDAAPPMPSQPQPIAPQEATHPPAGLQLTPALPAGPSEQHADQQAIPHSPVVLEPSLTRRLADPDAPARVGSSSMTLAKVPSPLDSPLTKKPKKRKRGPPGFKVLPMPLAERSPTEEAPITTSEPSITAPSGSTPLAPPPQVTGSPDAHADQRPETSPAMAIAHAQDPLAKSKSPQPIDVDSDPSQLPQDAPTMAVNSQGHACTPSEPDHDVEMTDALAMTDAEEQTSESVSAAHETITFNPLPLLFPSPESNAASSSPSNVNPLPTQITPSPDAAPSPALESAVSHDRMDGAPSDTQIASTVASEPVNFTASAPSEAAAGAQEVAAVDLQVEVTTNSPAEMSPFASISARVLCMARGASTMTPASRPVVLDFELSADELAQMTRWKSRSSKQTDDLSASLCISLAIYPISRFKDDLPESPGGTQQVTGLGCLAPWPRDGSVFLAMNPDKEGEEGERFTISPPFVTTVDKCVDLHTPSVHAGVNKLHVFQYRDHSDRVFVVIIHRPTRAQLAELQAARDRERGWRQGLERIGRIELQVPRLFPASMWAGIGQPPPP
ncbi:hypothetical protein C2E23DRAFT_889757 [Lenzites betulinus]|nr:hypothetical protein C2E23DRAFT_889757 [Lenzites betulinus]